MTALHTHRHDLASGARAMLPWLVGVAPFGMVIGVSAAQADLSTLAGWSTGPIIFTGSAQVATIEMLDAGGAAAAIIITALVINLRLILYSAAMAPHWRGTPLWWRLLAGYLLVDPSFSVGTNRYAEPGERRGSHAHYLGGAVTLWVAWLAAIGVGALAGTGVPGWLRLEFVIPLFLIGQVVPRLAQPASRRAALAAAGVAGVALTAPMHLGIAIAIIAGVAAGIHARSGAKTPPSPGPVPVSEGSR